MFPRNSFSTNRLPILRWDSACTCQLKPEAYSGLASDPSGGSCEASRKTKCDPCFEKVLTPSPKPAYTAPISRLYYQPFSPRPLTLPSQPKAQILNCNPKAQGPNMQSSKNPRLEPQPPTRPASYIQFSGQHKANTPHKADPGTLAQP